MKILKRIFVTNTLVILLILFEFRPSIMASIKTTSSENTLEASGVQLIPYGTTAFTKQISTLLTSEQKTSVASVLPQSAIVCNSTSRYIWGFTVIYRYPDKLSGAGRPWEHRFAISPGGAQDRSRMLAPDGCYLSTPISDLASSHNPEQAKTLPFPSKDALNSMLAEHESKSENLGEHATIVLDSVIFEDGEICGPDSALRMKTINDRIRANEDFVFLLKDLSGDKLRSKLQSLSSISETDEYSYEISSLGALFLAVLNHRGEEEVSAGISRMQQASWFAGSNRIWRRQ